MSLSPRARNNVRLGWENIIMPSAHCVLHSPISFSSSLRDPLLKSCQKGSQQSLSVQSPERGRLFQSKHERCSTSQANKINPRHNHSSMIVGSLSAIMQMLVRLCSLYKTPITLCMPRLRYEKAVDGSTSMATYKLTSTPVRTYIATEKARGGGGGLRWWTLYKRVLKTSHAGSSAATVYFMNYNL
ncbi:hypothetical protein FOFC_02385 [Fusarium oxysporum]|nr:hypothetical protein FOFC_02385 [Fusarium oxysporum]